MIPADPQPRVPPVGGPDVQGQAMRVSRVAAAAASTAAVLAAGLGGASPAQADDWGLNGRYVATSNGDWANTNEVFHDEATVTSTWTVTTTCSYPTECTGTVTSDQGWTATIYKKSNLWYVKRIVPKWEPCSDGTAADGMQIYKFWSAGPDAYVVPGSTTLAGFDETTGISGACGISKALQITLPFRLVKAG